MHLMENIRNNCDALHNLVTVIQFKKREKQVIPSGIM